MLHQKEALNVFAWLIVYEGVWNFDASAGETAVSIDDIEDRNGTWYWTGDDLGVGLEHRVASDHQMIAFLRSEDHLDVIMKVAPLLHGPADEHIVRVQWCHFDVILSRWLDGGLD